MILLSLALYQKRGIDLLDSIAAWFVDFGNSFYDNFIKDYRWKYLTTGLTNTLLITLGALILGVVLGFLIALVRTTHDF